MGAAHVVDPRTRDGYVLEVEDTYDGTDLDRGLWLPHYLPQWSSRAAAAARYRLGGGHLRLLVEEDQPPWCPEFDGGVRVSSLQTGVFSGPLGSGIGQRFEDVPEHSAEICVFEIFGRDVGTEEAAVGMGVHPFGDPRITDEFAARRLGIDVRDFHVYAVEWTAEHVAFFVDGDLVTLVHQSPDYAMQFMLDVYAFPGPDGGDPPGPWPKELVVDWFRGWRRSEERRAA